jgi:hypothetical protein
MSEPIYLSNVRLSFPKLIEASAFQDTGAKKFGADLLLKPSDTDFARFMSDVGKIAVEKWKENAQAVLHLVQNERKLRCFGNGAEKVDKKTFKPYIGYDGMVYISASSNEDRPPQIIRPDGTPIDNSNTMERTTFARKLYGGCYVNAAIRPWAQDNQFGRAIRCELIAIQFFADGEAFGEGEPDLSGMFKPVPQAPGAAAPAAMPAVPFPAFFGTPTQQ